MYPLAAGLVLCAALAVPCCAQRQPFTDDVSDITPWHTNSGASTASRVEQPRDGVAWGLGWELPAVGPQVYYVQRPLPQGIDDTYRLSLSVLCSAPTALEVQVASDGEARLYSIHKLPQAGWHDLDIDVGAMGRFAGFTQQHFSGPLSLRFWVDGNEGWAGGTVPRDTPLSFRFCSISLRSALADLPADVTARLSIDPTRANGQVSRFIYGQFLEHIYHSVEDGLFGELVRNRAFVGPAGFVLRDGVLIQPSLQTDVKTFAGDPAWTDYEFSLKARKTGGREGFLIIFRSEDDDSLCWWNLGGWGNVRHALEIEQDGQRHVASPAVDGAIETGKWYDIRVRVEGDHIQGWLDGEQLLDVREPTFPAGRVGLGTWTTQAEFADMKVTTLAGEALAADFASGTRGGAVAEDWESFPDPQSPGFSLSQVADSGNTGWAATLRPSGERVGMAQRRLNLVAGHTYHGKAWLRAAEGVRGLRAELLGSDGGTVALAPLSAGPEGWTEASFTLECDRSDRDGRIALSAEGQGTVLVDMLSLMRDDSLATGCRADLLQAVKGLQPTIVRWPGGCFASIYRWKRGIGPQARRQPFHNYVWGEWDSSGFGTDEFLRFCDAVGAEPLIVLNLGSWDSPDRVDEYLQEALDWIEYCNGDAATPMGRLRAANGHPEPYHVTHWELDNETWGLGVEAYAERVTRFSSEIRKRWPDLTLYACTFWEAGDPKLLELAGKHFDLISYHLYDDPNRFADGPRVHEATWSRYPAFVGESPNPEAKLAVTEWNAQSTDWRTGLFAGGLLNAMERLDVVQMATPALFLRRVDATDWDNAFINHDSVSWFPAPNYVVMKLYREHYQPNRVQMSAAGPLNAVATRSTNGDKLVLKVVNAQEHEVTAQVETGAKANQTHLWVVEAGLADRNTLQDPEHVRPTWRRLGPQSESFRHTFPAYSVSVLEFDLPTRGDFPWSASR